MFIDYDAARGRKPRLTMPPARTPSELKKQLALVFLAARSGSLATEQAQALEEHSAACPEDEATRAKLLGYYFRHSTRLASNAEEIAERKKRAKHVLWFIEHQPTSAIVPTPYAALERATARGVATGEGSLESTPESVSRR